jgi:hypothetical protein
LIFANVIEISPYGLEISHPGMHFVIPPRSGDVIVLPTAAEGKGTPSFRVLYCEHFPYSSGLAHRLTIVIERASRFALGRRVRHRFGIGPVVAVDGNKITVDFETGRKMLLADFVQGVPEQNEVDDR